MKYFATVIHLPPGSPPVARIPELLRLIFERYRWFRPERYGLGVLERKIDPEHIDYEALLRFHARLSSITIGARTDRDFILITVTKPGDPPHAGDITWMTSAKEARRPAWRASHLQQVFELMRMVQSPLAQAGLAEDYDRKKRRLVTAPDGSYAEEISTLRDYSEGLVGLVWRNFLGPPFVKLFGERLASLPSEFKQDLGDNIILVQPYALPTDAGTPEGVARERQLISLLGPECFYDHERHLKPTRVPQLDSPAA